MKPKGGRGMLEFDHDDMQFARIKVIGVVVEVIMPLTG
jgi:hypothetical protein